jgi:hypothetical protein
MQFKFLLTSFVLVSSALHAATIQIASDLVNESNNRTGTNVFITPHPVWAAAPAGAGWISYANTGMGPGAVDAPNSTSEPRAIFTEQFFLPGTVNTGSLRVWADDTASVQIDGVQIGPAANFVLDSACAAGSIGCEPLEFADISLDGLSQGAHVLSFSVYQVGGSVFGLLYSGSALSISPIETTATPEPGTIFLLGGGLIGLAAVLRRRTR